MADYLRPGVYSTETVLPRAVTVSDTTGIATIVAPFTKGPTTAYLTSSWREFQDTFGTWSGAQAQDGLMGAYQYFSSGGGQLLGLRVVGAGSVTATTTFTDGAVTNVLGVSAISPGSWANTVVTVRTEPAAGTGTGGLPLFNVIVYYKGTVVERHLGLSVSDIDPNSIEARINGSSQFITVSTIGDQSVNPVLGVTSPLAGGLDGDAVTPDDYAAALPSLDRSDFPLTINCPNVTDQTILNSVIQYAQDRGDTFVVVDAPGGSVSNTLAFANAISPKASCSAVYSPNLIITDPRTGSRGGEITVPPGAAVMGAFSRVDSSYGVWRAPAGPAANLISAIRASVEFTKGELDALNSAAAPVNAIRTVNGAGVCIMGARTLDQSSSDRYVSVRRTLSYLRSQLSARSEFALFEPNGPELWYEVRTVLDNFLGIFWQQGGLRGVSEAEAFYVKCDNENNTQVTVAAGELHVEVGIAVEYPTEFIVIHLSQIDGTASVTTGV